MMKLLIPAVIAGFVLDLLAGDPHWLYHPVRLVGKLISVTERLLRKLFPATERGERCAGVFLVFIVVAVTGAAVWGILWAAFLLDDRLGFIVEALMCYQLFAVKALRDESMKVYGELKNQDLEGARKAVSMIVGRDTQRLDEAGVTKAAVETVAENTSDGTIAPLFYMVIGGPVLAWCYKAINTMDSMVGYKNDVYLNFGRFAAKLDDAVNFLPARISGLLMIAASALLGMDWRSGTRIFKRDRFNHASPNSAQTEAVMAGVLNIRLAGDAWYFGKLYKKKTIGDDIRPVEAEDIARANRLLYGTAVLALLLFLLARWGILLLLRL